MNGITTESETERNCNRLFSQGNKPLVAEDNLRKTEKERERESLRYDESGWRKTILFAT